MIYLLRNMKIIFFTISAETSDMIMPPKRMTASSNPVVIVWALHLAQSFCLSPVRDQLVRTKLSPTQKADIPDK